MDAKIRWPTPSVSSFVSAPTDRWRLLCSPVVVWKKPTEAGSGEGYTDRSRAHPLR